MFRRLKICQADFGMQTEKSHNLVKISKNVRINFRFQKLAFHTKNDLYLDNTFIKILNFELLIRDPWIKTGWSRTERFGPCLRTGPGSEKIEISYRTRTNKISEISDQFGPAGRRTLWFVNPSFQSSPTLMTETNFTSKILGTRMIDYTI